VMDNQVQILFQPGINHFVQPSAPFLFYPLDYGVQRQHINDSLLRMGMHAIRIDTLISTLPPELFTTPLIPETTQELLNSESTDLLTRVTLYLISNNLVPRNYDSAVGIVAWFEVQDVPHLQSAIQFLISQNDTTSVATLENLFEYAILAKNVVFTKKLLAISRSHLVSQARDQIHWVPAPDRLKIRLNEALNEACTCQDLQLAKAWINLGASADSIYLPSIFSAIENKHIKETLSQSPRRLQIELDWVRMLLENGATVCNSPDGRDHQDFVKGCIEMARHLQDDNLMSLLIEDPWGDQYCEECTNMGFWKYETDRLPAKEIVELLLKIYHGRFFSWLRLDKAVELESLEAIEYCLSSDVKASSPSWWSNMDTLLVTLGQYRETRYKHLDFGASDLIYDDSISFMSSTNTHHDVELIAQNMASTRDQSELEVVITKSLQALPSKLRSTIENYCLHFAVEYDSLPLLTELLDQCAFIKAETLLLSVERRSPEMVSTLCNPPIHDQVGHIKFSPQLGKIWRAALKHGDASILKALSDAGLPCPLCLGSLIIEGKSSMLTFLNDLGLKIILRPTTNVSQEQCGMSLLEAAIRAKNIGLVDTLLQSAAADGDEGAMRAAVYHGMDIVGNLLSANRIFSPYRNSQYLLPALHLAIRRSDSAIIQKLLQSNARVDSLFNNSESVLFNPGGNLLGEERNAYLDSCESIALETAIRSDREPDLLIFRQILSCIANPNVFIHSADRRWATPLILAIRHRNWGAMTCYSKLVLLRTRQPRTC
jgi:hypothetical protein